MNVIIVDDEPLALEVLETYIQRMPSLKLVAKCSHAIEAFEAIHKYKVDLMFLDIQMPQITGIDFLKTLSNPPKVVLTTAYSNYALDGYELNVADYLLKPISFERFVKAVQKVLSNTSLVSSAISYTDTTAGNVQNQPIAKPIEVVTEEEKPDYIFVKADKKLIKIRFEDIFFVEGLKDYVILYTPTGRVVTLQTMKSLEEKLPAEHFIRVHRSYIVNIHRIDVLEGNGLLIDKKTIPIGKNYKDELLVIINKNRL